MLRKKLKICGVTTLEIASYLDSENVGFIGFVFVKQSVRYITPAGAGILMNKLRNSASVALIADFTNNEIEYILNNTTPDFLQLHGSETIARTKEIGDLFGLPIIKAVGVANKDDIENSKKYYDVCDMVLYDTKVANNNQLKGGHGKSFDWNLLGYSNITKPYFVAGGIDASNAKQAFDISKADYIDLSSGIEISKGVKSIDKIKNLLSVLNNEK